MTAHQSTPELENAAVPSIKNPAYALSVRDSLVAIVASGFELPFIYAQLSGRLPLVGLLFCHALALVVLSFYVGSRAATGGNSVLPTMLWLAFAALGPIGGLVGAVFCLAVRFSGESDILLDEWYARISRSTEMEATDVLSERVAVDRVIGVDAPPTRSFADVIETGSIEERQAALGHIARHFHSDYLGALALALKSREPVIRVQAAAVAARIKTPLSIELGGLLAKAEHMLAGHYEPAAALGLSHQLRSISGFSLVDEAARRSALRLAAALNDRGLDILGVPIDRGENGASTSEPRGLPSPLDEGGPSGGQPSLDHRLAALSDSRADTLEESLLVNGRFAEFRQLRRARSASRVAAG